MADFQEILDDSIKVYRHKETMPTSLETSAVAAIAKAARAGLSLGMPAIGITTLADRMLVEGRGDAGVNNYNKNNPKAAAAYEKLTEAGYGRLGAAYVASVIDKTDVSKRLGISFDEAWNGTGKSVFGKTGKDYAARFAEMSGASKDPRNSHLLSYMSRVAAGKLTRKEEIASWDSKKLIDMVYGTASGDTESGVEYVTANKSPFMSAYQAEVRKVTGKDDTLPLNNGKSTLMGPERMRWETDARSVLADTIRSNLGIVRNTDHTNNTRASIAGNSELQQVFQNLAEQAIKSLGIK